MSLNETWETSLTKEMTLLPCLKKSNRRVSVDVASTVRFFHGTSLYYSRTCSFALGGCFYFSGSGCSDSTDRDTPSSACGDLFQLLGCGQYSLLCCTFPGF